jgi:hypothetical protein
MTEQAPEGLSEVETADRLEIDRSEDKGVGDPASEVDRWEDEAATTAPAEPAGYLIEIEQQP